MDTLNSPVQPNLIDRARELLRIGKGSTAERTETVDIPEPFQKMVYEFLHTCFCLPTDQISDELVETIFKVSDKLSPIREDYEAVLSDGSVHSRTALSRAIVKHMGEIELGQQELVRVIEDVRGLIAGLGKNDDLRIARLLKRNSTIRNCTQSIIDYKRFERIGRLRGEAIGKMKEQFPDVFERWKEAPYPLGDETMAQFFVRSDHWMTGVDNLDNQFLTTYFDSAQFGLENTLLTEEVLGLSRTPEYRGRYKKVNHELKEQVIRHFEPEELRFTRPMDNLFVANNGTSAFQMFSDAYICHGNTVITTPQEYGEIMGILEGKAHVLKLPDFQKNPEYLVKMLKDEDRRIDYAVVSELSRYGTPFPLALFRELLDLHAPHVDLVIDGCQSIGRRVIDFHASKPSALIGSVQKGSDVGSSPLGLLMLADDFIKQNGLRKTIKEKGSIDPDSLARLVVACTPEYQGIPAGSVEKASDEDLRKMIISVAKRQEATQEMAQKFVQLVRAINEKCGNRIQILNPVNTNDLGCILTCKIKGLSRDSDKDDPDKLSVRGIAQSLGVTINKYSGELEEDSFRIAFHPFMDNQALMILGHVLEECCKLAK